MALNQKLIKLLNLKHTALLVIDIQKGYCDPNEVLPRLLKTDTDELQAMIPILNEFIEMTRDHNVPIIWTRMIEDPEYLQENLRTKMIIGNVPALTTPGKESFEYFNIKPKENDLNDAKYPEPAYLKTSNIAQDASNGDGKILGYPTSDWVVGLVAGLVILVIFIWIIG